MKCNLCPRECGIDREKSKGYCGCDSKIKVAKVMLHKWEEPPISGKNGSGAIFFSGCPLKCVYCQNKDISHSGAGQEITVERLSEIFLELQAKGANNINLVTPDTFIPQLIPNIKEAKINNSKSTGNGYGNISTRNMYLKPSTIKYDEILSELKDGIYITDYMGSSNTAISTTTGNISIQIFGFIVKNGKIKCGFNPCIMTTTIFELFNNVKLIGDTIEFTSKKAASPVLLIENISVASSN